MRAFDGTPVAASCWPSTSWPGGSIAAGSATTVRYNGSGSTSCPGRSGWSPPSRGDDGWLLGAGRGFVYLALDGSHRSIAEVAPAGTRMNDGACDPQGRFWAGTVADDHHQGGGTLYRLDTNGRTDVMLEGLTISNGIGWSPDGRTMYLIDSGPGSSMRSRSTVPAQTLADQRALVTVPDDVGAPDGMTVDAAGDLWVAIYEVGASTTRPPAGCKRSTRFRRRRARAAPSAVPGSTGSTSPRQPRTGPTSNATPSRPPGTSTASTPIPPANPLHRSDRIRRGGRDGAAHRLSERWTQSPQTAVPGGCMRAGCRCCATGADCAADEGGWRSGAVRAFASRSSAAETAISRSPWSRFPPLVTTRRLESYLKIELFGGTVGGTPEDACICWKRQRDAGEFVHPHPCCDGDGHRLHDVHRPLANNVAAKDHARRAVDDQFAESRCPAVNDRAGRRVEGTTVTTTSCEARAFASVSPTWAYSGSVKLPIGLTWSGSDVVGPRTALVAATKPS